MAVKFKNITKHAGITFLPKVVVAFENPNTEAYMIANGWAESVNGDPVYTYSDGEVPVDTGTIHNESGLLVTDIIEHGSVQAALNAGVQRPEGVGEIKPDDVTAVGE